MPGLNLRGGFSAYATGPAGVSAALPPSYAASPAGATISARAYGVGSTGDGGPALPAVGTITAGLIGTLLLAFIWYSLPR